MACTHSITTVENHGWECDWTGEWTDDWKQVTNSTMEDIDLHRMRCTQCGEIGYYSSAARAFHERGEERPDLGLTKIDAARAARRALEGGE